MAADASHYIFRLIILDQGSNLIIRVRCMNLRALLHSTAAGLSLSMGLAACGGGGDGGGAQPPPIQDTTPPSVPGNLAVTGTTDTSVSLSWNASADTGGSGLAGYRIYRDGSANAIATVSGPSFTDTNRSGSTTYSYTVRAYDNAGNQSAEAGPIDATTQSAPDSLAPTTPTDLVVSATTTTSVSLSWNASTDTGGSGLAGYKVYRGGVATPVATLTGTVYTDPGRVPGTSYSYTVRAYDNAGNESAEAGPVTGTTQAPAADATPPSVPANLVVAGTTTTSVSLSWSESTDTGGSGLAGYRIYRDGSATPIASVSATGYTDTGRSPATSYTYTVQAFDNAGNQSAAAGPVTGTTAAITSVTISGRVTFQRPSYTSSNTLSFNNLQTLPVRGATVEILNASTRTVLATTTTSGTDGRYSATISNTPFIVRVKARLFRSGAGGYDFEIRDNTSGDALYALDGVPVSPSAATTTVDLNAPTGWTGSSFTGERASAPFAILDMLWSAKSVLQAAEPGLTLPPLDVYWSPLNSSDGTAACNGNPDPDTGNVGTTFYINGTIPASAGCSQTLPGIYVLGETSDSDEFDTSVIAHEFGHYFQDKFSRDDSMGGPHSLSERYDPLLAFSEGWGNAFQGFVLSSQWYRDTFDLGGTRSFAFDMENNTAPYTSIAAVGFYSEASVQEFLWDVYDGTGEGGDSISLGYAAIHRVMREDMVGTPSLTSIYSFRDGLEARYPAQQGAIDTRLLGENIDGTGPFAAGQTLVDASDLVPVFVPVTLGTPVTVRSTNRYTEGDGFFESYNRLGARRYLRIDLPTSGGLTITVQGPVGSDPDFYLYRDGLDQCTGASCIGYDDSAMTGREEAVFGTLAAGTYVLELAECSYLGELCRMPVFGTDTDFTVTVTQP